jgi:hypothetical protein
MKKMRNLKFFMVLSIIAMIAFAGCTGKNELTNNPPQGDIKISGEEGKSNTNQGIDTGNEKTPPQDSSAVEQTPKIVEPVNFNKLIELLPKSLAGWSADKPSGSFSTEEGRPISGAYIIFTKGDKSQAKVSIQDYAKDYDGSPPQGNLGDDVEIGDTGMYSKNMNVKGFPALETHGSGQYDKIIFIKGRFLVHITVTDTDKDALNTLENSINFNAIAQLG